MKIKSLSTINEVFNYYYCRYKLKRRGVWLLCYSIHGSETEEGLEAVHFQELEDRKDKVFARWILLTVEGFHSRKLSESTSDRSLVGVSCNVCSSREHQMEGSTSY